MKQAITTTPVELKAALSLTDGERYTVQCWPTNPGVRIYEGTSTPDVASSAFIELQPLTLYTLQPTSGVDMYAWTGRSSTTLMVNDAPD